MHAIDHPTPLVLAPETGGARDFVRLEVSDLVIDVLTGIYSEETHMPQPLRVSVTADIAASRRFNHDTPLSASKNYLDPRDARIAAEDGVGDMVCNRLHSVKWTSLGSPSSTARRRSR